MTTLNAPHPPILDQAQTCRAERGFHSPRLSERRESGIGRPGLRRRRHRPCRRTAFAKRIPSSPTPAITIAGTPPRKLSPWCGKRMSRFTPWAFQAVLSGLTERGGIRTTPGLGSCETDRRSGVQPIESDPPSVAVRMGIGLRSLAIRMLGIKGAISSSRSTDGKVRAPVFNLSYACSSSSSCRIIAS